MKTIVFLAISAFTMFLVVNTSAQRSFTAIDTPVTENFDSLAITGSSIPWTDNSTIPGGYIRRLDPVEYNAGTGSANAGTIWSFGLAGSTERALGSIASGSQPLLRFGVRVRNDTGVRITAVDVQFVGEQWRNGGVTATHVLTFDHAQAALFTDLTTGTYTAVNQLDFSSLIGTNTPAAVDGNLAPNRTLKTARITVNIPPGEEIMLRWSDVDNAAGDHGLAIDNLVITPRRVPTAAAVSVSGSVRTAGGMPIRNAQVTISGGSLNGPVSISTGSFGSYSFDGLRAGQTYVVTVSAGRYTFAEPVRTIVPADNVDDLDFVAN